MPARRQTMRGIRIYSFNLLFIDLRSGPARAQDLPDLPPKTHLKWWPRVRLNRSEDLVFSGMRAWIFVRELRQTRDRALGCVCAPYPWITFGRAACETA